MFSHFGKSFLLIGTVCVFCVCAAQGAQAFWPFGKTKAYEVAGLDHDAPTKEFVQSVLRAAALPKIETDDADERAAALAYQERLLEDAVARALRARGYYAAAISYTDAPDGKSGTYTINAGQQVRISGVTVKPARFSKYLDGQSVKTGDALIADDVLRTQTRMFYALDQGSCALHMDVRHKVLLDTQGANAQITFEVDEGKQAVFNGVRFTGLETVKESYLRKFIPWKAGACFRREKVDALREALLSTGLFSRAEVTFPTDVNESGAVELTIDLRERAQRSIKAGMSYYTDEGIGAIFGWEHRNYFGSGEKMNVDLSLSLLEQSLKADLNKPYFLRKDQDLSFSSKITRQDTDAYEQYGVMSGARLSRVFNKRLSANVGVDFEVTRITEENGEARNFGLLSPLAGVRYDSRNDTLDPARGWLASYNVKPFIDVMGESPPFVKHEVSAQHYIPLHDRVTFAARAKIGAIYGAQNEDLPATQRFFAGGGGSVRGFGYQEIGPRENGDPLGGRSLVEAAAELRFKLTDKIGFVTFVDAGDVGEKPMPEFTNLSVGAGAGLRYYTGFGPVRFDVAVPMNNRETLDSNFQVYISIGQAF